MVYGIDVLAYDVFGFYTRLVTLVAFALLWTGLVATSVSWCMGFVDDLILVVGVVKLLIAGG